MIRHRFPSEHELQTQLEEAEVQAEILRDIKKKASDWERLDSKLALNSEYRFPTERTAIPHGKRYIARRAFLIAAVVLLLTVVPAAAMNWEEIVAFFSKQWETHTTIGNSPLPNEENIPKKWDALYMPAWVPDGFHPEAVVNHHSYKELIFEDDCNNQFTLYQGDYDFCIEVNTELTNAEPIKVNGQDGLITEQNGIWKLAWGSEPQLLLAGPLSRENMIRIAESVQPPNLSTEIKEKEGTSQ